MFDTFLNRNNRLPILSTLMALSYLVYILTTLASNKTQGVVPVEPAQASKPVQKIEDTPVEYAEIANWHLFGQTDADAVPTGVVPETQLQLKLQGLMTISRHQNHAHAFIATAEQSQKAYKVNDELPGGATLQTIEKDKVIILRNNQQESLSMERHQP